MKVDVIGVSALGQPITALYTSSDPCPIVIMSGLHGDEVEGHVLCAALFKKIANQFPLPLAYLPSVNPDGIATHSRWNANNVDLNRNFPTKIWSPIATNPRYPPGPHAESEPETKTLVNAIKRLRPKVVVDFHSYKTSVILPSIKRHGVLEKQISSYSSDLNIPVEYEQDNLGYSITGGFHDWCFENGIDNITIEVQRNLSQEDVIERYLEPTCRFLYEIATQVQNGGF